MHSTRKEQIKDELGAVIESFDTTRWTKSAIRCSPRQDGTESRTTAWTSTARIT